MKRFIFRKDWNGFMDWMKSINRMRWTITQYKKGAKLEDGVYTEANWWYTNYLEYMKGLSENEKEWIRAHEKHHMPDYAVDNKSLFNRWLDIVGNFKLNQLHEITNKEVGDAIRTAREYRSLNRVQVAKIIGINQDTLKAYENGSRTLPFDVYYKLVQLFDLNVGVLKMK